MSEPRLICFQLTDSRFDGQWIYMHDGWDHTVTRPTVLPDRIESHAVRMVETGSVVWDGDRCAEVYVPEDKLPLWRAEHDVEPL